MDTAQPQSPERQLVAEHPEIHGQPSEGILRDHAVESNDFGYAWLPRADDDKTFFWFEIFDEMYRGTIDGFFAWGMNPACSGANADKTRHAMKNLDWMVNVNLFDNETGSFWKGPGSDGRHAFRGVA